MISSKIRKSLPAWCLAGALIGLSAPPAEGAGLTRLDFLGSATLPAGTTVDGSTFGGISSLAYYPSADLYFGVSDDQGQYGPIRFYSLKVDLSDGRLSDGDVFVTAMTPLFETPDRPIGRFEADSEGMALAPGGLLYISSEGNVRRGVDPFIRAFSLNGMPEQSLTVPRRYRPRSDGSGGIRHNLGFEGIALSTDTNFLYVVTENALAQDGPQADVAVRSPARMLKFDLARDRVVEEYLVWVDAVSRSPQPAGELRTRGLVEILALDDTTFLGLEREFVRGRGHDIVLYQLSLEGADNVVGRNQIDTANVRPVSKELLFRFSDLNIPLDNLEAMAFGPDLPDGRRTLLVASDDNFSQEQRNLFLAFATDTGRQTPASIQGRGHRSPLAGSFVLGLEGIVTAVERSSEVPRLWFQSQRGDGDDGTSEALLISLAPGQPLPRAGDAVRISGLVQELGREGQLSTTSVRASAVSAISRGVSPPSAVVLGDGGRRIPSASIDQDSLRDYRPDRDAIDFYESLEGMRVEVRDPIVIGPTTTFGTLVVLPDGGSGSSMRTRRGGLALGDGDFNPERVLVDARLLGRAPKADVGDRFSGPIVGILGYDRGNFKVLATGSFPRVSPASFPEDITTLAADENHLTIATYNVLNLSPATPAARLSRLAQSIVRNLRSPDILALQEIQDDSGPQDDGVVAATANLGRLVEAIQAAGGPAYSTRQIDPVDGADGGQPGGNIRVAYLFNPDRVIFVDRGEGRALRPVTVQSSADLGEPRLSLSPGRISPTAAAFQGDPEQGFEGNRKSLAAEIFFQGQRIFLVNNHLKSKRGDDRLFGTSQPPMARTELQRRAQTLLLRRFSDQILAEAPLSNIVILGDMNEQEFRSPMKMLTDNQITPLPLSNLMEWVPVEDRYTFNYLGNSQVLDHILVSPNLVVNGAPQIDIVHVNADFADADAASDHDPVVVRLRIGP